MTNQHKHNLRALVKYPEWQTFIGLLDDFKKQMRDINEIEDETVNEIAAEVLGRKKLLNQLETFMRQIEIVGDSDPREKDNTYE